MLLIALAAVVASFEPAPCDLKGAPATFERDHGVQCGWVAVPLKPGSQDTIRLWTARVRASDPAPNPDPIIYINGGPGVATVDSILPGIGTSKTLPEMRKDRDIILFDQRGSGRSEEALCPDLGKQLDGIARAGLDAPEEAERNRAAFVACRGDLKRSGVDLDAYTTDATVNDLEVLRQAFGAAQVNLLSISYGSLVALHAMRTYPETIRSVVLNSPYPPNSGTWAEQTSITAEAYAAIDRACSRQPACRGRFGSIAPKLEATLAKLNREPIIDGKTTITGRLFASALWPLAVRSATVRYVPLAIDRAHSGDTDAIRKLVSTFATGDAFGERSIAQGQAILCHETGRTREWNARVRELYPTLAPAEPADSWDRLCEAFRPGYVDAAFFAPVVSSIPTLIYAGELDPAVPVADALHAMRFLSNASIITVPDGSHGPVLDDCLRGTLFGFIRRPRAAPDVSCVAKRTLTPFALDGLEELFPESGT